MYLVLDTNILFSALLRNSKTRLILLHPSFSFFLPEYALEEIENHKSFVLEKTGLTNYEFDQLLGLLLERVTVVPFSTIEPHLQQARDVMSLIDPDDVPFIALAFSITNDGIWTQDKHFEKQSAVQIWKTADLLKMILGE